MSGPFDFLHIKNRTAGSSNELSFDVLEAARRDLDDRRRANRASRPEFPLMGSGARSTQGSYAGVAGTSTLSAVPEVERRKRARRARAIRMRVLVAALLVALLAAGAFLGLRMYESRVDYTGRFSTLISNFIEIDKSMVEVDALMVDPMNAVERDARDRALEGFPDLEARLDGLASDARDMARDKTGPDDITALSAVEEAAAARKQMLVTAADAFKLSEIANRQVTEANDAWALVLAGDAYAREATELANAAATEDATLQAREKTEQAIAQMAAARSQLQVIQQGIAGLDFSAEIAYIDKRLESLAAGVETSDALLAADREAAIAANDAYNAADREAASLAASLPASISDQVKSLYADELAQKRNAYADARSSATTADSTLRSLTPGTQTWSLSH